MGSKTDLTALLSQDPLLQTFVEQVKQEPSLLIEGLWEGPKAALLALLISKLKKTILVISGSSADRLCDDVACFGLSALEFPSWETLPGEEVPPSPDLMGKRLDILHTLSTEKGPQLILAPLQAVLQKLPSPHSLAKRTHTWTKGIQLSFAEVPEILTQLGYHKAAVVCDKGEFALRGGILDIFPLSAQEPYRLEWLGDTIDEIRSFDPISQIATAKVESALITAAFEIQGNQVGSLFDYLGKTPLIIFNDLLSLEDRWVSMKELPGSKTPLFGTLEELFERASSYTTLFWTQERAEELSDIRLVQKAGRGFYSGKTPLQPLTFESAGRSFDTKRLRHPFISIPDAFAIEENRAAATKEALLLGLSRHAPSALELHLISSTESEKETFLSDCATYKVELPARTVHHIGYLSSGFLLEGAQIALFPMTELSHRLKPRRQKWRSTHHTPASDFHELGIGDIVVHYHNGIAKYLGLEKLPNHAGTPTEFLVLEYADKGKLFVPVSQSHLVSRYIGAKEEVPILSTLGSTRWQKTRSLAQTAIIGYADQLLRMQAQREFKGGIATPPDSHTMTLFEADFPFVETQDQLLAIASIKEDMQSNKPMDRLICGDVGYGKTEVAMRAAFKAVIDGKKQVAVLVPTTVLAMQHYETFVARMAHFPVRIGILSRFCSTKENRHTLRKVKEGEVDIIIGTHRMLSKDVVFKDLGLLIIDEEQRFGVRAKESLKNLKLGVDALTLSATPIPRTLYLSIVGAREISVINTPPQDRLPIKSLISRRENELIKNALLRELSRDGQAYFIHNRVETIFKIADEIQQMLPEARIVTGHGQMPPDELDSVFHSFKSGQADILVATTIIENGVDIPNANTILIDRADTFGIADLYQMRGRVGRWNRPSFAYFLVKDVDRLPEIARKRLFALAESSGFGAGMKIALRDLEIRGAGDILGTQQSGHVSSIGFHLYCKLLKKAIDALKGGRVASFTETKMEFTFDASLPESYINESGLRMEIYHRLGEATRLEEVDALLSELKDRFGPYPPSVLWLYHLTRLRLFASARHFTLLKFEKLTFTAERQVKKELLKKTLVLPKTKNPGEFEKEVTALLSSAFGC